MQRTGKVPVTLGTFVLIVAHFDVLDGDILRTFTLEEGCQQRGRLSPGVILGQCGCWDCSRGRWWRRC